jgi:ribonuclease R
LDKGVVIEDGELVEFRKIDSGRRIRSEKVRVSERLGDPSAPKSVSLIAIHQLKIPNIFPENVLLQSKKSFLFTK